MTSLLDLYQTAEEDKITVDDFPLKRARSLSLMDGDGACFVALDQRGLKEGEERLLLAHELGHCETGAFYIRTSPADLRGRHEERAWRWAIRRLVPREELSQAMREGYRETWQLADYFGVPQALLEKAVGYYRMRES